jgi:uncharacterized protein (DUF1330 family)
MTPEPNVCAGEFYVGKYEENYVGIDRGKVSILEGDWTPHRFVILEFESVAQAERWWSSPEYAPAKGIREQTARTNMIVVEGV